MPEQNEIKFMAEYTWTTLLSLFDELSLRKKLVLKTPKGDLIVGGEIANVMKLLYVISELSIVIKEILRKVQAEIIEEKEIITSGSLDGRVLTGLAGKYAPSAIPVSKTRLLLETPANLLLAATLVEVRFEILNLIASLKETKPELKPLREYAKKRLIDVLLKCEYLMYEPVLRPILSKAQLLAGQPSKLKTLEETVKYEVLRKYRDLKSYSRLLELRRLLRENLSLLENSITELNKTLTLEISTGKLYELFGFTLILQALIEEFSPTEIKVLEDERELQMSIVDSKMIISYNTLPEDVESRLARAYARGIMNGPVERELIRKLGGLPDTIILLKGENKRRILLVDYKYSRSYNYLVQARFKAVAYLYEFNADCAVIVTPTPGETGDVDEEVKEQTSFYDAIKTSGGAEIRIDNNGKVLAIVYVDPKPESLKGAISALKVLFRFVNLPVNQ